MYYKLVGKTAIPCNLEETLTYNIKRSELKVLDDIVVVSTIFLGLDHSGTGNPPILYETMVFGGKWDNYQDRFSTYEEAEEGHIKVINMIYGMKNYKESL